MKAAVVCGLPASGKTYFADYLAPLINAKHISSDVIRSSIRMRGKYDLISKKLIYDEMLRQLKAACKDQKNVVLDATFYKKEIRSIFIEFCRKHDCELKFIEIRASDDIIEERMKKKRKYSEADFEVYELIKKEFEKIEFDHLILYSDKEKLKDMLEKSLEYLE